MGIDSYAVINESTNVVENITVWDGVEEWSPPEGYIAIPKKEGVAIGWIYDSKSFNAPPSAPISHDEIVAENMDLHQKLTHLSDSQKAMIAGRISTLHDAIDLGIATSDEEHELIVLNEQLGEWKKYAVYLGRVPQQDGWGASVDWPEQPSYY